MSKKDNIWIITMDETQPGMEQLPQRGLDERSFSQKAIGKVFSKEDLARHFGEFFANFRDILQEIPSDLGAYKVDEIQLNLTVNAQGGFELIGKVEAGLVSGIGITLKRA